MSIHRAGARRDINEGPIVEALRRAGCLVERLSGAGLPDLLVWSPYQKRLLLLEVKDFERARSEGRRTPQLTKTQQAFHERWAGAGAPVVSVATVGLAMIACGVPEPT